MLILLGITQGVGECFNYKIIVCPNVSKAARRKGGPSTTKIVDPVCTGPMALKFSVAKPRGRKEAPQRTLLTLFFIVIWLHEWMSLVLQNKKVLAMKQ